MTQPLFHLVLRMDNRETIAYYQSIVSCMDDRSLKRLLDTTSTTCELWCGGLKISSSPIETSQGLRDSLIDNAQTILHRLRS